MRQLICSKPQAIPKGLKISELSNELACCVCKECRAGQGERFLGPPWKAGWVATNVAYF